MSLDKNALAAARGTTDEAYWAEFEKYLAAYLAALPTGPVGEADDTCPHCRGTGQPGGIMGGPEHGLCSWCKGSGRASTDEPTGHCAKCGRDWGAVGVERCDECPTTDAPSEPVSDLVKRLREAAVEVGKSGNILAATDLVSAASALTAAEARAAEAERSGDALLAAQNEIVNTVWGLLGGQDDTREGGSNLISRVAELVMRAEVAEAKIDELEHRSLAEGWRPIETAPKRGTYLVYQPVHRAGRDALTARVCLNDQAGYVRQSTHWMPIPQPPEAK